MTLKLTLFLSLSPFFTRLLCKHRYTLGKSCADADGLSSTVIVFECDPSYTGSEDDAIYFSEREQDSCDFEFTWRTKLACATPAFECIVEDEQGRVYDLSPLSKPRDNWLASGDSNDFYEINICRTITENIGSSCLSSRDAACQHTPSGSYSLGKPSAPKVCACARACVALVLRGRGRGG